MSQSTDITLSPGISGTSQRTELNDILAAILTGHSGASRPSYLTGTTGGWTKIVSGTVHELYYFDGTDDILVGTLNLSANTFTPSGQLGTFGNAVSAKTGAFTAVTADYGKFFTCNATTAAFTAALDTTSTLGTSWFAIFQKTDATANAVTIDPAGSDTVNGSATIALNAQYDTAIVIKASNSTFVAIIVPGTALRDPAANGIISRTALNTSVARVITGSTNIAVSNGDGVSGNPTISITGQIPVANGGTGRSTVTSGSLLLGAGTSAMTEVAPGTTGNVLTSNGSAWVSSSATAIKVVRQQRFAAGSSTYTPHANMVMCFVQLQAAGGSGPGNNGGGDNPTHGIAGGDSTFGTSLLSAIGGARGMYATSTPSVGGTATGGDLNIAGQDGGYCFKIASGQLFYAGGAKAQLGNASPLGVFPNGVTPSGVGSNKGYGCGGVPSAQVVFNRNATSGAAGGYCEKWFTAADIGASKAVVVGQGGAAVGSADPSIAGLDGICIITEYCSA